MMHIASASNVSSAPGCILQLLWQVGRCHKLQVARCVEHAKLVILDGSNPLLLHHIRLCAGCSAHIKLVMGVLQICWYEAVCTLFDGHFADSLSAFLVFADTFCMAVDRHSWSFQLALCCSSVWPTYMMAHSSCQNKACAVIHLWLTI